MISQSMRVSTAAESRYRIAQLNSRGRKTLILALGQSALISLAKLQKLHWNNASFGLYSGGALQLYQEQQTQRLELNSVLNDVDVVVLLITADSNTEAIEAIGEACSTRRIMTSGFVLEHDDALLASVLSYTRRVTVSLVTDVDTDALVESLRALRA